MLDHKCLLAGDFNVDLGNIKGDTGFYMTSFVIVIYLTAISCILIVLS